MIQKLSEYPFILEQVLKHLSDYEIAILLANLVSARESYLDSYFYQHVIQENRKILYNSKHRVRR